MFFQIKKDHPRTENKVISFRLSSWRRVSAIGRLDEARCQFRIHSTTNLLSSSFTSLQTNLSVFTSTFTVHQLAEFQNSSKRLWLGDLCSLLHELVQMWTNLMKQKYRLFKGAFTTFIYCKIQILFDLRNVAIFIYFSFFLLFIY